MNASLKTSTNSISKKWQSTSIGTVLSGAMTACLFLGLSASSANAQSAEFLALGDLSGGGFFTQSFGISADGTAVVGGGSSSNGDEAFRWTQATGMTPLGDLPGGSFSSNAFGVSASGSVVVGQSESASGFEAFRWTQATGMVGLGDLAGGSFNSNALGVSSDGSVIVGRGNSGSGTEAFRWTQATGMVGLDDLPGGGFDSQAFAVSGDGSIVVGRGNSALGTEAFRWTQATGMVGLGDLPGGSASSQAFGISSDGSTIVGQSASANGTEAFRWTQSGGMRGLGDLPGGAFYSSAHDASSDGSVIVGQSHGGSGFEAFRWTQAIGMESVRQLLVDDGIDMTGWSLDTAQGVSDAGDVIVGYGNNPSGNTEAWLARLGSGLITASAAQNSVASLAGVTARLQYSVHDTSAGLLDVAWNGACSTPKPDDFSDRWCAYMVGQGTSSLDDLEQLTGALAGGFAYRGATGFRTGIGPTLIGGQSDLAGGGSSDHFGYGIGGFIAAGEPTSGPQVAASAAWVSIEADIERAYLNGSGTDMSQGTTNGSAYGGEMQAGWRIQTGPMQSVTPFANLRYSQVELDGYTESGGGFPAIFDDIDQAMSTLRLGIEGKLQVTQTMEVTSSVAWGTHLNSSGSGFSGSLIGLFGVDVANPDAGEDFIEASLRAKWTSNGTHIAATIGGMIGVEGDDASLFGRLTFTN